jgi:proteasome accessory factor A
LYLDVGSHPEYATAECDLLSDLLNQDRAGENILNQMAEEANRYMLEDGLEGEIYLFKNNTDSSGNSYGCHENYLIRRRADYTEHAESVLPFLITRQILVGAGKVLNTPRGTVYAFSQRADHMWDGVSSSTTRSRPIINTRDEPHADAELYRRLHVIVGDSNMSETTTLLKVASMDLILGLLETGKLRRDLGLENAVKAIREVSHDATGKVQVALASGVTSNALALQTDYLTAAQSLVQAGDIETSAEHVYALDLWQRSLVAVESGDFSAINQEVDWAIKKHLIEQYCGRHGVDLASPEVAQLDLRYHDINPTRGLFRILEAGGHAKRVTDGAAVVKAQEVPPQTTRAKLRGDFIAAARLAQRDVSVDWIHLKINDQVPKTVLCKDPFASTDERVDALIANL